MRDTPYFSVRTGTHPTGGRLDLVGLKRLVLAQYRKMESDGYFQQAFGFVCVDAGEVPGTAGPDVESFVFRKLLKPNLWPIEQFIDSYTESDLFDVIELLHDYAVKGVDGTHHGWGNCGWHYDTFDKHAGQNDLRIAMNEILGDYGPGYNLASVTVRRSASRSSIDHRPVRSMI